MSSQFKLFFRAFARFVLAYWFIRYVFQLFTRKFKGPFPFPLLGNFPQLAFEKNLHTWISKLYKKYGEIFVFSFGNQEIIAIRDPKAILRAMRSTDRAFILSAHSPDVNSLSSEDRYKRLELVGYQTLDLFSLWGEPWKLRRRLLQPCFDQKHVRKMLPTVEKFVHKYHTQRVDKYAETGEVFNVLEDIKKFTLDVIGATSFSTDFRNIESEECLIATAFDKQIATFQQRNFLPFQRFYKYLEFLPSERTLQQSLRVVKDATLNCVRRRRKSQAAFGDDLLSVMIKAVDEKTGLKLTDDQLLDELRSFMFAGFDTTSVTMSNFLYFMAKYPKYQRKLQEELDKVCLQDNSFEIYSSHEYLNKCLKESQRLTPIAPFLLRRLEDDIEASGHFLQKGTCVMIPISELHHDETIYKDPYNYNPGNFDADIPKPYFLPFGHGAKMCIGFQLALIEMKCFLFHTMRRYTVHLHETTTFEIVDKFVTGPKEVKLVFKRRDM